MSHSLRPKSKRSRARRPRHRLRLEPLESRRLLATLVVNSTADAVDADPGDGVCEISPGGSCTLRAAVQEANALANSQGPDRIEVPVGTYQLTIAGIGEQQALTGDLDIFQDLIIQGAGADETIIDGGMLDRVFDIFRSTVEIRGVTIQGGLIQDDEDPFEGSGGGIRNGGDLTLVSSNITGNIATNGAGLANYNGTLEVVRSVITGNGDSTTVRGGGIANYSYYDPANLQVTESTITGNRANIGGGINNHAYDGIARATVLRSTISGNTALNGAGISNRGVYYYGDQIDAELTIQNSTISGNTAEVSGGGIFNEADESTTATVDVTASTIAANSAAADGGGLLSIDSDGASVMLQSSIFAENTAGGDGPDLRSSSVVAAFSLIESPLGHLIVDGISNNIVGQDPLLGSLADNGGFTLTHELLSGSPAIDQGNNDGALRNDQRGSAFARTVDDLNIANAGDGTDIGSVEVGQVAATADLGDAPEAVIIGGKLRSYPTNVSSDGARHIVLADGPFLGSLAPDAEPDGQPAVGADGDDLGGIDDEDGLPVEPLMLTPGEPISGVNLTHDGGTAGALLSAWIDLNVDGDWDDAGEQILSDVSVPAGRSSTSLAGVTIPANAVTGTTFVRVRISTQVGLTPRGQADDGEVEDFVANIGMPPPKVADLSLLQAVDNENPVLGENVVFTISISNDGPDPATGVEVATALPFELIFQSSSVTQGTYDDLDEIWEVGTLAPGAVELLRIVARMDTSDSISHTVEIIASDQTDPDSTPDNGVDGEDDQATVTLGTCLTSETLRVGSNFLVYSCSAVDALVGFVRGSERGSTFFEEYGATTDIADAEVIAIAIADPEGVATAQLLVDESELGETIILQAFEMRPRSGRGNTLSLEVNEALPPSQNNAGAPQANTNLVNPLDVNNDKQVTAMDALLVINSLAIDSPPEQPMSEAENVEAIFLDTNGDFAVSPLDALLVINGMNSRLQAEAEILVAPPSSIDTAREEEEKSLEEVLTLPENLEDA